MSTCEFEKLAFAYALAAGFLVALSNIVLRTLVGTCSKVSGSMEYDARPLDSDRMAVA